MFITEEEMNRRLGSSKNLGTILVTVPDGSSGRTKERFINTPALPSPPVVPSHDFDILHSPRSGGRTEPGLMERLKEQNDKVRETPKELKTVAASLVAQGMSIDVVSRELAISKTDIKSANAPDVKRSVERIRDLAIDRLLIALGLMTQDKFENAALKDLTASAANLSKIIEQTSEHETSGTRVQFVLHTPEVRKMGTFQVIDV